MASDSLTLSNYMIVARFLAGRVDSTLVRLQKRTQKPVSAHTPPKYTPKKETVLMEHLRKERGAL